jgi:hypothetical protein
MKVAPITPTVVTEGTLYFKTQCGHNVFTDKVIIQEVEPVTGTVVVSNGLVDPAVVAANFVPKGGEREFAIRADGTLDIQMPAGIYTATVKDGNGGQPEVVLFEIKPAYTTQINVLGHAFSGPTAEVVKITITKATYGATVKVIDVPASHTHDYEAGHVHAKKVHGFAPHDFRYNGDKYQIVGNQAEQAFIVTNYFCARPANYVCIIVQEQSHMEGTFIDVTAEVQQAVDAGVTSIVFNNAKNPGGIFDTEGNLIVQITDPAYGIVKDVHIEYDGGVIDTKEYQTINL